MLEWLVFPDLHYPYHDPLFVRLIEKLIKVIKPSGGLVGLGDALDFFQLSDYDKDPSRINNVYDDLMLFKNQLDRFEDLLPKGTTVNLLAGNHEIRCQKIVWRKAPQIAKLIKSLPEVLDFPARNKRGKVRFIWHDYSNWKSCKLGDLTIHHGSLFNKHTAATLLDKYHCKILTGHSHRLQLIYQGDLFACTLGHGSNEHETAHLPHPMGWTQALALVTVVRGIANIEVIHVKDGRCVFRGKVYEA
jgi:hypothetical protein